MSITPDEGTTNCFEEDPDFGPEWFPDIGPWGGWRAIFPAISGNPVFLEVYVSSYDLGFWTWVVEWSRIGSTDGFATTIVAAGGTPIGWFPALGAFTACPSMKAVIVAA